MRLEKQQQQQQQQQQQRKNKHVKRIVQSKAISLHYISCILIRS